MRALIPARGAAGDPDFHVELHGSGDLAAVEEARLLHTVYYDEAGTRPYWTTYGAADGCVLLRVHHFADFRIEVGAARVICVPHLGVADAVVEQLVVDVVLPRLLHLLGRPCLHASAVELSAGHVVAMSAPARSGKSTLCTMLAQRGGAIVSDDALAPTVVDGRVLVERSYPHVRIWSDSALAVLGSDDYPAATPRVKKKHRVELPWRMTRPPLGRFLLLRPDGTWPPRARELSGTDAFGALMRSVLRFVPHEPSSPREEFELLSAIAAEVPVMQLHFRHRYDELDELAAFIEAL